MTDVFPRIRRVSEPEAKQEILALVNHQRTGLDYFEIAETLNFDLWQTIRWCDNLVDEGAIRATPID